MYQDFKKDNVSNELTTFEKHQKILNPERDELYGG
jgi:hypothetical protein